MTHCHHTTTTQAPVTTTTVKPCHTTTTEAKAVTSTTVAHTTTTVKTALPTTTTIHRTTSTTAKLDDTSGRVEQTQYAGTPDIRTAEVITTSTTVAQPTAPALAVTGFPTAFMLTSAAVLVIVGMALVVGVRRLRSKNDPKPRTDEELDEQHRINGLWAKYRAHKSAVKS